MKRAYGDFLRDARETIAVEEFIYGLDDLELRRQVFFVIKVI